MSGRLCCYKQQQHSKLLAQSVFKVSAFHFNTYTKTCAPLSDCRINNALIQFVPSCQDTRTQFVDVLDPLFSDIACGIISCLVVGIFMPMGNSIATEFCHFALVGPVIMRRCVECKHWLWCKYFDEIVFQPISTAVAQKCCYLRDCQVENSRPSNERAVSFSAEVLEESSSNLERSDTPHHLKQSRIKPEVNGQPVGDKLRQMIAQNPALIQNPALVRPVSVPAPAPAAQASALEEESSSSEVEWCSCLGTGCRADVLECPVISETDISK